MESNRNDDGSSRRADPNMKSLRRLIVQEASKECLIQNEASSLQEEGRETAKAKKICQTPLSSLKRQDMPEISEPLFSFGLVADVQYSDLEDSHTEGRTQRYREAPGKLEAAVKEWQAQRDLCCIVNLGDTINGNSQQPERNGEELEKIASIFDQLRPVFPVYHAVGNHCLSVPREQLLERLQLPGSHYSISLPAKWQIIFLDTTEMSGHGRMPEDSQEYMEAAEFKRAHPLSPENPQMSDWNGGISSKQMRWLQEQLRLATASASRVIVAAHHQAGKGGARDTHLAWNWSEIKQVLVQSGCVQLYLAGHDHMGGHTHEAGIHWLTVEALLEAPTGGNAFAVVRVFEDRLVIEGRGVTNRTLISKRAD